MLRSGLLGFHDFDGSTIGVGEAVGVGFGLCADLLEGGPDNVDAYDHDAQAARIINHAAAWFRRIEFDRDPGEVGRKVRWSGTVFLFLEDESESFVELFGGHEIVTSKNDVA